MDPGGQSEATATLAYTVPGVKLCTTRFCRVTGRPFGWEPDSPAAAVAIPTLGPQVAEVHLAETLP